MFFKYTKILNVFFLLLQVNFVKSSDGSNRSNVNSFNTSNIDCEYGLNGKMKEKLMSLNVARQANGSFSKDLHKFASHIDKSMLVILNHLQHGNQYPLEYCAKDVYPFFQENTMGLCAMWWLVLQQNTFSRIRDQIQCVYNKKKDQIQFLCTVSFFSLGVQKVIAPDNNDKQAYNNVQDVFSSIKIDPKKSGYITNNGYVDIVVQKSFNRLKKNSVQQGKKIQDDLDSIARPKSEGDETQANLPFEEVKSDQKDAKQNEPVECYLNDKMNCKVRVWLEPADEKDPDLLYICGEEDKYQQYLINQFERRHYPPMNNRLQINRGPLWIMLPALAMLFFMCRRLLS